MDADLINFLLTIGALTLAVTGVVLSLYCAAYSAIWFVNWLTSG